MILREIQIKTQVNLHGIAVSWVMKADAEQCVYIYVFLQMFGHVMLSPPVLKTPFTLLACTVSQLYFDLGA